MTFHLSGMISIPLEDVDLARKALSEHIAHTRAEVGCLYFVVQEEGAGVFRVSEGFVDRRAFEAHQARKEGTIWARITRNARRDYKKWED